MLHITGKRKLCAYYSWLQVGKNQAFIDKHSVGMGNCTLGVHEALSYHPDYAGSNLEAIAALEFSRRQSASGYWGDTPCSMIFQVLARLSHPLAAFLVLRSIPGLIRDQHPDGLWNDYGPLMGPVNNKTQIREETADEVVTLRILMTLKHFGFLERSCITGNTKGNIHKDDQ